MATPLPQQQSTNCSPEPQTNDTAGLHHGVNTSLRYAQPERLIHESPGHYNQGLFHTIALEGG
jgi:hypothetical protein